MAQIIVRNLEDSVRLKLQRRAARHGRSLEEEIRHVLCDAVKEDKGHRSGFGTESAKLFRGIGLEQPIPELRGFPVVDPWRAKR